MREGDRISFVSAFFLPSFGWLRSADPLLFRRRVWRTFVTGSI